MALKKSLEDNSQENIQSRIIRIFWEDKNQNMATLIQNIQIKNMPEDKNHTKVHQIQSSHSRQVKSLKDVYQNQ